RPRHRTGELQMSSLRVQLAILAIGLCVAAYRPTAAMAVDCPASATGPHAPCQDAAPCHVLGSPGTDENGHCGPTAPAPCGCGAGVVVPTATEAPVADCHASSTGPHAPCADEAPCHVADTAGTADNGHCRPTAPDSCGCVMDAVVPTATPTVTPTGTLTQTPSA